MNKISLLFHNKYLRKFKYNVKLEFCRSLLSAAETEQVDKYSYIIYLFDDKCEKAKMSNLIHELVHVKQFLKNELKYDSINKLFIWKNKKYITYDYYNSLVNKIVDLNSVDDGDKENQRAKNKKIHKKYKRIPWEKDAFNHKYMRILEKIK